MNRIIFVREGSKQSDDISENLRMQLLKRDKSNNLKRKTTSNDSLE